MANQNRPFGFRPVQTRNGAPWNGKTRTVIISAADTNAYFVGDMVTFAGSQVKNEIDGKYYERVTKAAGGGAIEDLAGAITGIQAYRDPSNLYTGYRSAGAKANSILVEIPQDRNVVYVCQEDSLSISIPQAASGLNLDFVVNTGTAATRQSGAALDSSTPAAVTATLPIRLLSYDGSIDNEAGEFAIWYCTINTDPYSNKTGA